MSADSDMVDLKPCPFCGGEAEISFYMRGDSKEVAGFYVECGSCSAGGEPFDIQGEAPDREEYTKSKAIAAWNARAALDASGIGEMVAENRELRNIIASLGYCAPEASLEFMRLIPGEVALSRARATQSGEG